MTLASLSSSVFGGFVELTVVGSYPNARLDITDSDVKCGNDLYCIQTTKGSELDLDFKLQRACTPGGPQYRLTGMQFAMVQYEPDGSGGMVKTFGKYDVPAVATGDFGLDARGNVQWTGHNRLSDDKIKLKNRNQEAYVIYYQIEAKHCDDPSDVIYLDPRIENTGR
jgi:hypothetical protein